MQPCVSNLIKVLIGPKAFCHDIYSGEDVEAAKEAFLGDICKRVEKMLENRQFLIANNEPTVIDIIFYNEMSTSLMIMRIKGFKRMFPRIEQWVTLMGEIPELNSSEEQLVGVLEKYQLE